MGKKGKSANKYRKVAINRERIKNENKKAYQGIVFFSLILLTIVIGTSYALFSTVEKSKKKIEVQSGTFDISFTDSNFINLENTYPMTDEEGLNTDSYEFSITNTGTLNGKYNISLEEDNGNTLDKRYIKYSIKEGSGEWSTPALLSNSIMLAENKRLDSGASIDYQLKIWLDESAPNEVQGMMYKAKIVVSATQTNANVIDYGQPIININGADIINIEENSNFIDPGISSVNDNDTIDVSSVTKRYEYFDGQNIQAVDGVDVSRIGTYYIYYEAVDSNNNKGMTIRIVNVYRKDTTPPIINILGESQILLDYDAEYTDQGATAQDNVDGDLTSKIVVVGEVNVKQEGMQIIKYLIIDSEGNTASATRTVVVKRKYADATGDLVINKELSTSIKQVVDINITTSYAPLTYVIATNSEKPNDNDYKTIEELQNEGVAEDGRLVFSKNGNYIIWVKDSLGEVIKKEISIYGIDTTKPTCTWFGLNTFYKDEEWNASDENNNLLHPEFKEAKGNQFVGKNVEKYLTLTCTDPVDIEERYLTDQVLQISNTDIIKITDISAPKKSNLHGSLGYEYTITLKGLKAGTSRLSLPSGIINDKVGNSNDETPFQFDITVAELDVNEDNVVLDLGGENSKNIEVKGANLFDLLFYKSSDENIVHVDSNGVMTAVSPGVATVSIVDPQSDVRKDISVKVVNTVKITFTKEGTEGVESISSTHASCTAEDSMECEITLPNFTALSGYEAVGWNLDKEEIVGTPQGTRILVSQSDTYYPIAIKSQNENIRAVYTYSQVDGASDYCITGNEPTCQVSQCIANRAKGSCPVGTIVKYAVNNSEDKIFYVLHDDGRKMTLQQRENTVESKWYDSLDNSNGPVTALDALDTVTSSWTNVNNQSYTMGTTNFLQKSLFKDKVYSSSNTKCPAAGTDSLREVNVCADILNDPGYTMSKRVSKTRFITVQEVQVTGCGYAHDKPNCPVWMYNYLENSIINGGTVNDTSNSWGYHTMSSFNGTQYDWYMMPNGVMSQTGVDSSIGIRAVIEIDK